jgi:hypothetical protein
MQYGVLRFALALVVPLCAPIESAAQQAPPCKEQVAKLTVARLSYALLGVAPSSSAQHRVPQIKAGRAWFRTIPGLDRGGGLQAVHTGGRQPRGARVRATATESEHARLGSRGLEVADRTGRFTLGRTSTTCSPRRECREGRCSDDGLSLILAAFLSGAPDDGVARKRRSASGGFDRTRLHW